jgi:protein TonB
MGSLASRLALVLVVGGLEGAAGFALASEKPDPLQYYPPRARAEGVQGRATLACTQRPDGSFAKCSVISEAPAGYGFGDAALAMSGRMALPPPPAGAHHSSDASKIVFPIVFQLPGSPKAP